jgi:hypothetical protein
LNWQVEYALENFKKPGPSTAEHVDGDLIRVRTGGQPDVLAAISAIETMNLATAQYYVQTHPNLEFLCAYRANCVWEGAAIAFLEASSVGWGNFGTLASAAADGNAKSASHKIFKFCDRLIRQYGRVARVDREFDRIHRVHLRSGTILRIGMVADYEPNADAVRTLWERFGPVDIVWNINPNGSLPAEAIVAGRELGAMVMKWDDLRDYLRNA